MRFIPVPLPLNLPKGWSAVHAGRVAKVNAQNTPALRAKYIKKHGSWSLLKYWLSIRSNNKCWYCEAKSTRAPCDVDHFRPKLGITVDGVKLMDHHGYYWLAYEWSNFRLSCQRCNRPERNDGDVLRGKANEFPIQSEANRCKSPTGPLDIEEPRLLDPCSQTDCELLAHGVDGEVKPLAAAGTWENKRARYTIDRLGFNDWSTPEDKKHSWRSLDLLIRVVGCQPEVVAHLQEHLSVAHEYSSFFRSVIGTHRDKDWVETLL